MLRSLFILAASVLTNSLTLLTTEPVDATAATSPAASHGDNTNTFLSTSPRITSSQQHQQFTQFTDWLVGKGATLHPQVNVAVSKLAQRGLYSNASLVNGTLVCSVPFTAMLSIEHAVHGTDAFTTEYKSEFDSMSDTEVMSSYLALIRTRNSELNSVYAQRGDAKLAPAQPQPTNEFTAYIDSLPAEFTTPLFWQQRHVSEAQRTTIVELRQKRLQAARRTYDSTKFGPKLRTALSFEDYVWGLSIVLSRLHRVRMKNLATNQWTDASAFVPLADLLNTGTQQQINTECATNMNSTHFECRLTRNVTQYEQLLTPYGHRLSNAQLLSDYGFVWHYAQEQNVYDTVQLRMPGLTTRGDATDSPESLGVQLSLLTAFNMTSHPTAFVLHIIPEADRLAKNVSVLSAMGHELLQYARILALDRHQVTQRSDVNKIHKELTRVDGTAHISPANEKLAVQLLISQVDSTLRDYETTFDEDESLWAEEKDSLMRSILNLRQIEKLILLEAADVLEQYQVSLENLKESAASSREQDAANAKPKVMKVKLSGDRADDPIPHLRKGKPMPAAPAVQQIEDEPEDHDDL